MNCDHQIFYSVQKNFWKTEKKQRYKIVYIIILRVKKLLIPLTIVNVTATPLIDGARC